MFRFGDFEVDVAARRLRHRDATVHLEPQAFDLLVCLIEQRDRVVPKAELLDGVWGHRFLSEASLTTRIKEVRRAVDDDGTRQHTVRNVRGRGYQFVAPLTVPATGSAEDGPPGDAGLVGASPTWDPAAVSTPDVVALVTALDRLPLTIEMAAARARSMSFDELAQVIAAGAPLLQVTHRAPARRHRSLDSLVRSSAELLDDHHREVFEGFSVFARSVGADDAAGVLTADDPQGIIFDLASLAERSLLVADVRGPATSYSMLATVRTVAARWSQDSGRADELQRRHAEHFLRVLRAIDDELRTPREAEARRRLGEIVDEIRAAHRWARTADPGLASAMSAALFHGSYPTLWHEPAAWSRALLADCSDIDAPGMDGAILVVAGAAAHTGDLRWAREHSDRVRQSADGRLRAIAAEIAADVALYEGDLDAAREAALELRRAGEELGDRHALAFGVVDEALARAYGGDTEGALAGLADVDSDDFAPTDRAWLAYARGDALSLAGAADAAAAFQEAIELGDAVGNRFVVSVSLTSMATEHARRGDRQLALATYGRALDDFVRHGNTTHAVTALRNLIALLADLGDDRGAVVIAGAVADEGLRVSYGAEAERIAGILDDVETRVGGEQFGEWFEEGRHLESDVATRAAAALVASHRA